jgi:hypothetical protein
MKRLILFTAGLALVWLTGCVVTSVYPYYTPKDVTFDTALLGTWSDPAETNANKDAWTFEKIGSQTYQLTVRDGGETNAFDAHLFTLGGQKFLDCLPRERHEYSSPTHVLLRVKSIQPQLEMYLLKYEWLGKLVEANPKAIRHIITPNPAGDSKEGGLLTVTADTAELQKFIRKHLKTEAAWSDPMLMQRQ